MTLLFGMIGIVVLFGGATGAQDLQGVTVGLGSGFMLGVYFLGVVQFALAHFFFFRSIERISVQEASLIALVEPVLNPLWVALCVGEVPSSATFIGGGLILVAQYR